MPKIDVNFRNCGVFSFLAGTLLTLLPFHAAWAEEPRTLYQGEEVDIQAPCTDLKIEVDASLTNGVMAEKIPKTVSISVAKDEAQKRILVRANGNECTVGKGRLSLSVPPNFSVIYHDSPKASVTSFGSLASFEGAVLEGDVLNLGHVDSLDLKMSGNSKVSIEKLKRAAQLVAGDSASFSVQDAQLSVFSVFGSETAQILVSSGHIGAAHFTMADRSQAQIFAAVGTSDVRTKDDGFVRLGAAAQAPEITDGGVLQKEETPLGSVVVSQPDAKIAPLPAEILSALPKEALPSEEAAEADLSQTDEKSEKQPSLTPSAAELQPAPGTEDSDEVPTETKLITTASIDPIQAEKSSLEVREKKPSQEEMELREHSASEKVSKGE
ncbi:hypothetical protein FAI40_05395 [Acetobacteraceae bacterium]|nr:hypothetical protein FAI40_05395 [Acetobacteraceae bacterium]